MSTIGMNLGIRAHSELTQPLLDRADRQAVQGHGGGLRESIRSGLEALGQRFTDAIQSITRTGRHSAEAVFARANPYTAVLAQPPRAGENGFQDNGIIERYGDAILDKLDNYREAVGSKISREEMCALINTGEHLVNAISRGDVQGGTISLTVGDQHFNVDSSLHTTRAISWYLTAKTAETELVMGGDQMVTKGSMMMKDPGNRLFNFLNAAPTSYGRVSSHFNERAVPGTPIDRLSGQPLQRGIEDYGNKLPGGKGAMLFNKLQDEQMFMKFEHVGMPTIFRLSGHGESHNTALEKIGNAFNSIGRCIKHSLSFITSRFDTNAAGFGVHREHAHKDATRDAVFEPFVSVMSHLEGVEGAETLPDDLVTMGKKWGTDFMSDALENLPKNALQVKPGHEEDFAAALAAAKASIAAFRDTQGPDFGAERKGMEAHVSLETYPREIAEQEYWQEIPLD